MAEAQVQEASAAQKIQQRRALVDAAAKPEIVNGVATSRRNPVMQPARMKLAEYDRQDWVANAERGHTVEDCLEPGYWAHMAAQMGFGDHIEVRAEEGEWIAELLVVEVGTGYAKVMVRARYDLVQPDALPAVTPKHEVAWKGPQHRFAVIRLSDQVMVKAEFKTREDAAAWMREHERVIAG